MEETLPPGYFADYETKQRYERRRRENQRQQEEELREAGLQENAFGELECAGCNTAVEPTGEGMSVMCRDCGRVWSGEE